MTRLRPTALAALTALAIVAAGCASPGGGALPTPALPQASPVASQPSGSTGPGPSAAPSATPAATGGGTPPPGAPAGNPAADALAGRAWATATLTDVATGQPFTIRDLAGRTIFVEAMAIWCTNCRAQQGRFTEALARLDPAKVAYVVLTVDPSETAGDLARYRADRGFSGRYAVAGREVSRALEAEFGPNVLNPPSVPLVVISPTGEVYFGTGAESVDDIVKTAGG